MTNRDSQILAVTLRFSRKIISTAMDNSTWTVVMLTTGKDDPNASIAAGAQDKLWTSRTLES